MVIFILNWFIPLSLYKRSNLQHLFNEKHGNPQGVGIMPSLTEKDLRCFSKSTSESVNFDLHVQLLPRFM